MRKAGASRPAARAPRLRLLLAVLLAAGAGRVPTLPGARAADDDFAAAGDSNDNDGRPEPTLKRAKDKFAIEVFLEDDVAKCEALQDRTRDHKRPKPCARRTRNGPGNEQVLALDRLYGTLGDIPPGLWRRLRRIQRAGGLVEVAFHTQRLSGVIPPDLYALSHLEALDLSQNALDGALDRAVGGLTRLTALDLNGNQLRGRVPQQLGKLTELRALSLKNNPGLDGTLPHQLGRLTELRSLDLKNTGLTGPLPSSLGELRQLTYLDVRGTGLTGGLPAGLRALPGLTFQGLGFMQDPRGEALDAAQADDLLDLFFDLVEDLPGGERPEGEGTAAAAPGNYTVFASEPDPLEALLPGGGNATANGTAATEYTG